MKTSDHVWTDPHADELVQRHRMHSNNPTTMMPNMNNSLKYRPSLQINVNFNLITKNKIHVHISFFCKVKTSCKYIR